MKNWIFRVCAGLFLAVLSILLSAQWAQAGLPAQLDAPTPTPTGGTPPDCRECHWDIYVDWEGSAHGRGLSCGQCHLASQQDNHARLGHGAQGGPQQCMGCHTTGYDPATDTWQEDDVHCSACHNPLEPDHPNKPMPTNRSVEVCGKCHIQARFEWEVSQHGLAGVTCVNCHNQHKTSLKIEGDQVSEQCAVCHESRTSGFTQSVHAQQGISCGDCHLANLEGPVGEGSAKRNHTFEVDLKTCVACHAETLHSASAAAAEQPAALIMPVDSSDSMASAVTHKVSENSPPFDPVGFVAFAGFTGLGIGVVATPLVGGWLRRVKRKR